MDYPLLQQKASQIEMLGLATLSSNTLSSDTYYVMPGLEFTCSGTISGFLLGIDIRIGPNRDMFPNVSLYSPVMGMNNQYSRVSESTRTIYLEASNFSRSGVYEYRLSEQMSFSMNDVLGIYQPNLDQSVVQFYYQGDQNNDHHLYRVSGAESVTISNSDRQTRRRVLIHPIITGECKIQGI